MLIFAQDNFNRPNQSGFGTASDGSTWSIASGAATPAISGNEGVVNGVSAQTFIQLGSTTKEDAEALVKIAVPSVNYVAIGIFLRSTAGNTAYRFRLNSNNAGQGIGIVKTVAGVSTNLTTGFFTVNLNTLYWIRARIVGNNLFMKGWEDGTSEPGPWTLTTTNSDITGPGGVGIVVNTPQTADTARFDDFSAFELKTILDFATRSNLKRHPLVLAQDNFIRPNQSGFGTGIDGEVWEYIEGDQAATITSNAGQITSGSGTATFCLGTSIARDVDITARLKSTADGDHFGIAARLTDPNTQYRIYWADESIRLVREVADIKTTLATTVFSIDGAQHDNFYWVRAQVFGGTPTTVRAKIWQDGTGEPGAWTATTSDTNPLTQAGRHGLHLSTALSANVVAVNSYLAMSLTPVLDWPARAGLAALGVFDFAALARLGGLPTSYDFATRARLAGLGLQDWVTRANLAEAPIPLPITPNSSYTIKIAGQVYRDQVNSLTLGKTIDGRTTLSFTILDAPGTLRIVERTPIEVIHSVRGEIFKGFVNTPEEENIVPNPTNRISITCIDQHWLAEKRVYEGDDFENEFSGVVAAHLTNTVLVEEGLEANFVIDRDTTLSDFQEGTLNNVVAVPTNGTVVSGDGALELAPAGQTVSVVEETVDHFASGTLTDLEAAGIADSGYLALETRNVLKYSATCTIAGGGDLLCMHKIWSGSQLIAAGDALFYWIWISSDSPEIKAGVDFTCTDGTTLRNAGIGPAGTDQHGIPPSPNEDLAGLADNQWYFRRIGFTLPGKTISNVSVAIGGDEPGDYAAYFRLIVLLDSFGAVKATFFDGTLQTTPTQVANNGYINAKLEPVLAYLKEGTRISPAYSLTGAGIARNSLVAWAAEVPEDVEMRIESSLDLGATWQVCESFQSIPNLLPGTALIGRSLMFRETIINNSPDPTQTAKLHTLTATIQPSFAATKQDNVKAASLNGDWSQGTLTNLVASNDSLHLNQFTRNWDDAIYADQDTFGNFAFVFIRRRQIGLEAAFEEETRSRIDTAGQWQNFTAEVDVFLDNAVGDAGLVYRTTGWQNNNDTYAYAAYFSNTIIALARGTNSAVGSGSKVVIASQVLTLDAGNWHRLKVEVSGNNHKVYLDDVLFLNANDSTHTGAGFIGLRYNNTSIDTTFSALFDNFGVLDVLTGTWVSPAHDLSSVGTCEDSYIAWDADTTGNSAVLIEASIDSGTSWQVCENGATIPGLVRGMNLGNMSFAGVNLQVRATLSTPNASVAPVLRGLTTAVIGRMQASGFRIGIPLSLSPVGRVGSSVVSWTANRPNDETTFGIDVSPDGATWTEISDDGTGGILTSNSVPFLRGLSEPYRDTFDQERDTYSLVHLEGGEDAMWAVDVPNSRLVGSGGIFSFYRYNDIADFSDGEILFDSDYLDNGGVVWRLEEASTSCYMLAVSDNLLTGGAGVARLYRVVGGMQTQLGGSALIPFKRNIPARLKVSMVGGTIAISIDGISILTYTDPLPLQPGYVGLRSSGGTNRYSQWRVQQYGDDVIGKALYTQVRLSTTDPLFSPQLLNLTVAVLPPEIEPGKLIPETAYSIVNGSNTDLAQAFDDLAEQSGDYWWNIQRSRLNFRSRTAVPAPWIAVPDYFKLESPVKVSRDPTLYRNEQVVIGGTDVTARVDKHIALGGETFFQTSDPIQSISKILINGQEVSFGLQGVDENKQWFYQEGEKGITKAEGTTPLVRGQIVEIHSLGIFPVVAKARADGQIVLLQAIDKTSGIVTKVETVDGLGLDAAIELAIARIQQYAKLVINLSFTVWRPGLEPGQLLPVFLPQHGIKDIDFLITDVTYVPTPLGNDNLTERFQVKCTSGPVAGQWEHLFS